MPCIVVAGPSHHRVRQDGEILHIIGPTIGVIRIVCRRPETNVGAAAKIDAQEVVAEDLIATNGVSMVGGTENENADGAIVCDAVARAVPGNDV